MIDKLNVSGGFDVAVLLDTAEAARHAASILAARRWMARAWELCGGGQ